MTIYIINAATWEILPPKYRDAASGAQMIPAIRSTILLQTPRTREKSRGNHNCRYEIDDRSGHPHNCARCGLIAERARSSFYSLVERINYPIGKDQESRDRRIENIPHKQIGNHGPGWSAPRK